MSGSVNICYFCGKETDLPFRCKYCNLVFCEEHRLPEQHNCIKSPNRDWDTFRDLKVAREGYPRKRITREKKREYDDKPVQHGSQFDYEPVPIHGLEPKKQTRVSSKKCGKCSVAAPLYLCDYCGGLFCDEHIRPEDHSCGQARNNAQIRAGFLKDTDTSFIRGAPEPLKKSKSPHIESKGNRVYLKLILLFLLLAAGLVLFNGLGYIDLYELLQGILQ